MDKINLLIIGNGGREHALCWKLAQSPRAGKLYAAPGNGGTKRCAENVPINAMEIPLLLEFAKNHGIGLTIVGPDEPLASGIVDAFQAQGLRIFGPTKAAAQIESSKVFAKNLMEAADIKTAEHRSFSTYGEARDYASSSGLPIVIKASGLAFGKGVRVCNTEREVLEALHDIMLKGAYGDAGSEVVIEKYLEGPEISVHAFCDGKSAVLFPPAQDHKRALDGDLGKNTGGMGAIAPAAWVADETLRAIKNDIVQPLLNVMAETKRPFTGLLYPGLIMTKSGPKVLEFNARFGDPETEVYMRLLKTDLLDILEACVDGELEKVKVEWHSGFASGVVLTSDGYPDEYKQGMLIDGLEKAAKVPGVVVFHAGTNYNTGTQAGTFPFGTVPNAHSWGYLETAGGRVFCVTAIGDTIQQAIVCAYEAAAHIHFKGMHYRRDIGVKALKMARSMH